MYKLVLSREASRFYERCDKPAAKKLARCFAALEQDPRGRNSIKPLKGQFTGAYRYRVGDLRVVYTINDATVTVFVITIANRKDVYE
jgi:mRNA interferase RelE/StbE